MDWIIGQSPAAKITCRLSMAALLTAMLAACGGSSIGRNDTGGSAAGGYTEQAGLPLVFNAFDSVLSQNQIYGASDDGAALEQLNETLPRADANASQPVVSPDGKWIAFRGDLDTENVFELYVMPVTGGPAVRVNAPAVSGRYVYWFEWSPDGTRLAYNADPNGDGAREIFIVDYDGNNHKQISNPTGTTPVLNYRLPTATAAWSPNSRYVRQRVVNADTDDLVGLDVYDTASGGASSTRVVNFTNPIYEGSSTFIEWASTSSFIAFIAEQDIAEVKELYLVTPNGSSLFKVNDDLSVGGDVGKFEWSPNGRHIAYRAHKTIAGINDLYVFTIASLSRRQVSVPRLPNSGGVFAPIAWSPDSTSLAYRAYIDSNTVVDLYTVKADGSDGVKINPLMPSGSRVQNIAWSPLSDQLAYSADQETPNVVELFAATPGVPGIAKLNAALTGADILHFSWSPDGAQLVYSAGIVLSGELQAELFVADAGGLGVAQLDSVFVQSWSPYTKFLDWSPDSLRVTYVTGEASGGKQVLRSVSVTGGVAVDLGGTLEEIFGFSYLPL
jgi:Tol biopolymer transport system component